MFKEVDTKIAGAKHILREQAAIVRNSAEAGLRKQPNPGHFGQLRNPGVVPNSDSCQIITPLVLVGLGFGVGEG